MSNKKDGNGNGLEILDGVDALLFDVFSGAVVDWLGSMERVMRVKGVEEGEVGECLWVLFRLRSVVGER
jgi:hypothetical protein